MSCCRIFLFWTDILDVALCSLAAVKATTCIQTLSISTLLISLIFFLPLLFCSFAASPLPLHFHVPFHTLCLSFPFSLSLSLSRSLLFSLVSFEVLNNERATLPVKLVGKSRLKLHGKVQRSRILSSGPQGDERGGGSIRSIVSMWWQWQWLHRSSMPSLGYINTAWMMNTMTHFQRTCLSFSVALIAEPWQLSISWQDVHGPIRV